ncbi:MAG: methyltransferase domain-containing protein [Solirubrobacterales bacterium]|nr:methyltransferase domain-containing protein [Solirubrobacterales bacterium]
MRASVRLRQRLSRGTPPREELVARHVRGRSFVDVGCMWSVDGAIAFAAEAAGATDVTGVDVMGESETYRAEHARRGSRVRFVQGDLHDPATVEAVGVHDVVWCSGVLYHAPHPLLTLERLRAMTAQTLILATETLPLRGNRCEFAPAPGRHPTHTERFDPARGYVNWFWGISPGALGAMVEATGFRVQEEHRTAFHTTVVAAAV